MNMLSKNGLRPVEVKYAGKKHKGYFHKYVYNSFGGYSETRALIELEDGRMDYYDPYFMRFLDRRNSNDEDE